MSLAACYAGVLKYLPIDYVVNVNSIMFAGPPMLGKDC